MNRTQAPFAILIAGLLWSVSTICAGAEEAKTASSFPAVDLEFFENKVRPLLSAKCLKCHGHDPKKIRGGLLLTTRAGVLKGGDSGPAVVPGKPAESLLISAVKYDEFEMPPNGQLSADEISILTQWVKIGLPDPRVETARPPSPTVVDIEAGRNFWAFQPPRAIKLPVVRDADWPASDIDRFILARLDTADLEPVADANRGTLVRRVYFALIGLPPAPKEIDAFVTDPAPLPDALASLVDRLLESQHFGERWGRHWLDVARFAESSGGGRSLMFKDAWRFRDYVIRSYNQDKPFHQFVMEQVAGDLLPHKSRQERADNLIGTGFLALGPTNYELQDKALLSMEVVDEQISTISRAFLGLTLGCARCHDHKFDPIPTRDYYAMAGIFTSTQSLIPGNVSGFVETPLPPTDAERRAKQAYDAQVADLTAQFDRANRKLQSLQPTPSPREISARVVAGKSRGSRELPGIVIDDTQAKITGDWLKSVHTAHFVDAGYVHDQNQAKGDKFVEFTPNLKEGGLYEVRISYSAGGNRAPNVPVIIDHQDGRKTVMINQTLAPPIDGLFVSLGQYRFEANNRAAVTISTAGTTGHVIVDSVQFLSERESGPSTNKSIANAPQALRGDAQKPRAASPELQEVRKLVGQLDAQLKALKKKAPRPKAVAMSVKDQARPADGHVHVRGAVRNLGQKVSRGFLQVLTSPAFQHVTIPPTQSGRLQLAHWIASADNPLTARVYVNRVWRHLFGIGLVESTDNLGKMGRRPSHPQLLDYLALQFVADGWSTKKLIRRIMLSRVYRLSNDHDDMAFAVDDRNRLLWRANRRRLDAEVIRDSMLAISGQLDATPGGLTIRKITQYDLGYKFDTVRRSVYVPAFRNSMLDLFEVFDFANPNLVVGHRNTSTLPTQALFLMNSPFVIEQARETAKRILSLDELDESQRVSLTFRRVLGRMPTSNERTLALKYLQGFDADDPQVDDRLESWSSFCHSLLASVDFRYVE